MILNLVTVKLWNRLNAVSFLLPYVLDLIRNRHFLDQIKYTLIKL